MAWFDLTFLNRVKITTQASQIIANQTDFPVFLPLSLLPSTFFDKVQFTDGSDIVITEGETTKLKREVVSIDTVGDKGEVHFKTPTLNSGSNTDYFIYYNKAAGGETNDTDTWNSGYKMVHHNDDDPDTSTVQDSTSNNNDGTKNSAANPNEVTGIIEGKAQQYQDGQSDEITVTNNSSIDEISLLTLEFILNITTEAGSPKIFDKFGGDFGLRYTGPTQIRFADNSWSTTNGEWRDQNFAQDTDVYFALTIDRTSTSNDPIMYRQGSSVTVNQISNPAGSKIGSNADLTIGNSKALDKELDGTMDEVRISDVIRSANYIKITDNTLFSPASFLAIGTEEDAPVAGQPMMLRATTVPFMRQWQPVKFYNKLNWRNRNGLWRR